MSDHRLGDVSRDPAEDIFRKWGAETAEQDDRTRMGAPRTTPPEGIARVEVRDVMQRGGGHNR